MKKEFYIVCFMSSAAVYAVSSAFAAQTQTDLYTSSTYEAGVSCDLLNPSIWKVGSAGGEQFAGSVAETADNINFLNISHSMPDGINCDGAYSVSDSLVVAGINADISLGTENWGYRLFSVADGKSLRTVGDFGVSVSTKTWNPIIRTMLGENSSVEIGGDFSLRQNEGGQMRFQLQSSGAVSSFKVAGNARLSYWSDIELGLGISRFEVGGVLSLSGGGNGATLNFLQQTEGGLFSSVDVKLGGLDCRNGKIQISSNEIVSQISLEFTNSVSSEYSGAIARGSGSPAAFNITMNASDAENGKQVLRFSSIKPYEYYSNADISNVTVERGELSLGMHSGMKGDLLQVSGAGAVFSATGLVTGEIGSARFSEAWLSAGKIRFDFSETEGCDKIVFDGAMNVMGNFEFELNLSSADFGAWLKTAGLEYMDYTIVEFSETNVSAGELAEMLSMDGGIKAEILEDDFADGKLTLRLELAQVPEPAAFAAAMGAAVLIAAARRKRK